MPGKKKETEKETRPTEEPRESSRAIQRLDSSEESIEIDQGSLKRRLLAIRDFQAYIQSNLKEGRDYGKIPGAGDRMNLLKPGAEKIVKLLGLRPEYEIVDMVEDWDKPFFRYFFKCVLFSIKSGVMIDQGVGECNSKESKFRFRWVPADQLPPNLDPKVLKSKGAKRKVFEFEFAIKKRETEGEYGKEESYWDMFSAAIKNGTAKKVSKETRKKDKEGKPVSYPGYELIIDKRLYQVENDQVFDLVNTIIKMGKKRCLVDAALSVGRLSDLFTQDMEEAEKEAVEEEAAPEKSKPSKADEEPSEDFPSGKGRVPTEPEDIGMGDEGADEEPPSAADLNNLSEYIKAIEGELKARYEKDFINIYPEFRRYLGELAGKKMGKNFVGLAHGKWFLEGGDLPSVKFLADNLDRALEMFDGWFKAQMKKASK